MFKFSSAINAAVAAVFVLPALTLQGPQAASLEDALVQTVRALESLAGFEQRLAAGEPSAALEVLRWTEPALPAGEARDRELDRLRAEVERLQVDFDALAPLGAKSGAGRASEARRASPAFAAPPTTGLDDGQRSLLGGMSLERRPSAPGSAAASARAHEPERTSFEPDGYAADPLRLGRAYFRQGNYLQALAVLEPLEDSPEASYWKARCLEKLGRSSEARDCYEKVCANPAAGDLARRAKDDLDFLSWRLSFEKKLALEPQRKGP